MNIRTASYVLAEMRSLNTYVGALSRDILKAQESLSSDFKRGYVAFSQEWQHFFDDNSGATGWLARNSDLMYDKLKSYRDQALTWRQAFEQIGGKRSPVPLPELKPRHSMTPYLIGAGALALGIYLFKGGSHDE